MKAVLLLGGLCAAAVLLLLGEYSARFREVPAPHFEEFRAYWLSNHKNAFVTSGGGFRVTHPDLVLLGNNRVRFEETPPAGTFRIFCVGGSTTAGWPFHPRGGYPSWLAAYLRDLLPGKRIEVVNAGMHAFDSSRDAEVLKEILAYHPDLVILFEGYNDQWQYYYLRDGWLPARAVWACHVWLISHSRLYGFIRDRCGMGLYGPLLSLPDRPVERRLILRKYRRNLEAMVALAQDSKTPLLLLSLPVNGSRRPAGDPWAMKMRETNEILLELAARRRVPLLDLRPAFSESLFVDDFHPNLDGYSRIALAICRKISGENWIAPAGEWQWRRLRRPERYRRLLGLDDPAWLSGAYETLGDSHVENGRSDEAVAAYGLAEKDSPDGNSILRHAAALAADRKNADYLAALEQADEKAGYPDRAAAARRELRRAGRTGN